MFKRIVVAVDGSETADQALQEAIRLAKKSKAQLRIVHVIDITNVNLGTELPSVSASEPLTKAGTEVLRRAEARAAVAGLKTEIHLLVIEKFGQRVPQVIADDAEAWKADLIVICSHGRSGISHLLLGSVAEGVMRVSKTPVLLIPGK